MPLTDGQKLALKNDINANTNTVLVGGVETQIKDVPNTPDNNPDIAAWYNLLAIPAYKVYKPKVLMSEIMLNGFNWTRVDNLSIGKARIWEWMTEANQDRSVDPSKPNIRAGINAVWVGTQADLDVRAAVYLHCFKDGTNADKLFKVAGNGTVPDANGEGPATLGYFQPLTGNDITEARK